MLAFGNLVVALKGKALTRNNENDCDDFWFAFHKALKKCTIKLMESSVVRKQKYLFQCNYNWLRVD